MDEGESKCEGAEEDSCGGGGPWVMLEVMEVEASEIGLSWNSCSD